MDNRATILLLEEDDDAQRVLKAGFRKHGFRVLLAVSLEDALDWMSMNYIHADLVVVDLVRKSPEEALKIGRTLRERAKYDSQTPLVVMPEQFSEELQGTDDNVGGNDWVCYYADADQLHRLLERLSLKKVA
jgi:DNA-binding response OmpR family regulator